MLRLTLLSLSIFLLPNLVLAQSEEQASTKARKGKNAGKKKEWTDIFDGKTLSGWDGDPRLWSVKDGVIHGETTAENKANGNTFLIWKEGKTKNFELSIEFRCNATNNSGIQYRSKHITDDSAKNKWVVRGYQHEIRNENKFPNVSSFIYGEGLGRNRICLTGEKAVMQNGKKVVQETLIDEKGYQDLFKLDEWNRVRIMARGRRIKHFLNGKLVLDFTDAKDKVLKEGVLALQLHAGKPMWTEFRKIRFRELPEMVRKAKPSKKDASTN